MSRRSVALCLLSGCLLSAAAAARGEAGPPRVLPAGARPDDARLGPLKDLNGYFPFTPPASAAEWPARAERVRRRILVAEGLWPMPARTPLHAVIHGRIDCGDYTVEQAYFESAPGFFVTGNLYRPKGAAGRVPGVLVAHGHFPDARFEEKGEAEVRGEIADGAERFEEGGKNRFQSMCVRLARMGCVVWQWDMLGYCDSQQLSLQLVHHFAKQRPEMDTAENWGLYSPQAEAHLQSPMGLQTLNAVRSLDFLLSLPEVDPARIAMTGASGGATQTILLGAIDPRVKLAFPAVMVSTAMQGGCTCENASLLRVGTGNVEFAALFAPKPMGMTTADDWTKEFSAKGYPQLQRLYALLGAPKNVMLKRGEQFRHNYNAVSRSAFYGLLDRTFRLGQEDPVIERDYRLLRKPELTVWDAQHPAPRAADPEFERGLLRWWDGDAQRQLAAAAEVPAHFRELCGPALDIVLDGRAAAGDVEWTQVAQTDRAAWTEAAGLLRNRTYHEELPAVIIRPGQPGAETVVWLGGEGKAALYAPDGALAPEVRKLVEAGATVMGVDLFGQGEFLADGRRLTRTPAVDNPREAGAYTFGYNDAVFVQRVHDILSAVKFARRAARSGLRVSVAASEAEGKPPAGSDDRESAPQIVVVGFDGAGPWVAAARAEAGGAIDRAAIDTGGFRFGGLLDLRDPNFLPGGAKYGDLPGMLALGAPGKLWVAGETEAGLALAKSQYAAAGSPAGLEAFAGPAAEMRSAALAWLLADFK